MIDTYPPSADLEANLKITEAQYDAMYKGSIEQPDIFWAVQAKRLDWYTKPTIIKNTNFGSKETRMSQSNGTRTEPSTLAITASTVTYLQKKTTQLSSSKATIQTKTKKSPTAS